MTAPVARNAHVWARDGLDWYVEPADCTTALLTVERFNGPVLDPACGSGNIVKALLSGGVMAMGADIIRREGLADAWFRGEADYLTAPTPPLIPNIVTNPPFFRAKGAEAFIHRALESATGKVAVFADLKFLAGGARATGLFAEHPPARVWILAPRPSCPPGEYLAAGKKAGGGTADWCWLVWDLTAPRAETRLGWLRRGA